MSVGLTQEALCPARTASRGQSVPAAGGVIRVRTACAVATAERIQAQPLLARSSFRPPLAPAARVKYTMRHNASMALEVSMFRNRQLR